MATHSRQLQLLIRSHGGKRDGAGRKRVGERPSVPHRGRERHDPRHPVHVTFRAAALPTSLRQRRVFTAMRSAIARASDDGFRVLHFSVQSNHLHLVVEADGQARFTRGLQGLAIRVAKAVNRVLGRHGRVWAERFHARWLTSPRAVRNALVYVLQNWRKHGHHERGVDPCSSARWFGGWGGLSFETAMSSPVVTPGTWLARWGWRRHGLIRPSEVPRSAG